MILSDVAALEVACIRQVGLVADRDPTLCPDPFQLLEVELGVIEHPVLYLPTPEVNQLIESSPVAQHERITIHQLLLEDFSSLDNHRLGSFRWTSCVCSFIPCLIQLAARVRLLLESDCVRLT